MKVTTIDSIRSLLANIDADVACLVEDDEGKEVAVNPNEEFRSASLIKLAIYDYAFSKGADLTKQIEINEKDIVGGAGVIQTLSQRIWSLGDLMRLMISVSDNTATNAVIREFTMASINDWLQTNGYKQTRLQRFLMDTEAPLRGKDNFISALEAVRLMNLAVEYDRTPFMNQQVRFKLPGSFDETRDDVLVANKTGEGASLDHDVARFEKNGRFVNIALLTDNGPDRPRVLNSFQKIGQLIYDDLADN
ncbi:serine hydrolase [Lentilactobacillus sp. Marseille-Q4993]|uniref:serine hydrolase n=1 Tax=Lentilactobacillus sp. Marseille-Q4993 TaxID=3039492 RepID=UPI0024BC8C74|nr:serine hydrolase [Lentilactobacillus sp. Marseille-Q4993]